MVTWRPDSCPITRCARIWFLHAGAIIFKRHPGLLVDPAHETCRDPRSWCATWISATLAGDVRIDVDVQVLGFLHQQKLIDLVSQRIRRVFLHRFLQIFGPGQTFRAQFLFQILPRAVRVRRG